MRRRNVREPLLAVERRDAGDVFGRPAPAGDLEAETPQHKRCIAAQDAEPHDADRDLRGRWLREFVPNTRTLLRVVTALSAMVHQHVQDDVFRHPHVRSGSTIRTIGTAGSSGSPRM